MIALLHDFLPRGAKRVLIAVAGIFGAAFSFAFVDILNSRIADPYLY